MDLRDLVHSILQGDLLTARQWVADAYRARLHWEHFERPDDMNDRELTVAAGLTELLAQRAGAKPPAWTLFLLPLLSAGSVSSVLSSCPPS